MVQAEHTITVPVRLKIFTLPLGNVGFLPAIDSTKIIVTQAIVQLQAIEETLAALKQEMQRLASTLCPNTKWSWSCTAVGRISDLSSSPKSVTLLGSKARNPWSHSQVLIRLRPIGAG